MIDITGLSKAYGDFTAVHHLSFSVQRGEVLGLVGPNGAGKTTTLRAMAGIIPPTAGEVRIGGYDIVREPIKAKRELAFIPDEPRLFDYLTVRQHLIFVARLYGVANHEALVDARLGCLKAVHWLAPKQNELWEDFEKAVRHGLARRSDVSASRRYQPG